MIRRSLIGVVVAALAAGISCSREPSSPPASAAPPKPLVSGIELTSFDQKVRPQDDPFLHVNGGWLAKTEIPPDKSSYGSFDMLFDKSQVDLRTIVEEAAKAPTKTAGSEAQKIGDFYESFMNEAKADELGLKPLEGELAAIDRIQTKSDLARYFGRMFKLNLLNPLVGFVDGDAGQPDHEILYVFQGGLGLPDRNYYLQNDPKLKEYREKYVAFLSNLLKLGNQSTH